MDFHGAAQGLLGAGCHAGRRRGRVSLVLFSGMGFGFGAVKTGMSRVCVR